MITKFVNYAKFMFRTNKVMKLMTGVDEKSLTLVADECENTVDRAPDATAFIFEDQIQSFAAFDARANQVANWALKLNLSPGDTIALVMENCPDYVAIWVGLSKVGVVTALVNSSLEGAGLAHCINIVNAKGIIAGGEQARNIKTIQAELKDDPPFWDMIGKSGPSFSEALDACPRNRPNRRYRENCTGHSTCVYIYTSGTTGLPKAARVTHARMRGTMRMSIALANITPDDVVYNVLPFYHITGGVLGVGATLYSGAATCLRRKFSASAFWSDVVAHEATAFVYIGELCRYLINTESHPEERAHKLRVGFGNGLRGDVWSEFIERFQVGSMRELYGSTEGNVSFANLEGRVGKVGQAPAFLDGKLGIAFVKFDIETEEPIRNAEGYCIKCKADEPGEVLGLITGGRQSFEGYQDKGATQKKILTNVFKPGDQWFRTGDLLSRDKLGYVRFIDRIGDTYRWKGENVATNEVSDVLSRFKGIQLANVYGVEVPGTDGRAGMASITIDEPIDYEALVEHLSANLPAYAMPVFIREKQEADTTGTFKFRKVAAVEEGFDINRIADPIHVLTHSAGAYQRLTSDLHSAIIDGSRRI